MGRGWYGAWERVAERGEGMQGAGIRYQPWQRGARSWGGGRRMERWGVPGCREGVSAAGRVCGAWVGVPAVGRGLQDGGMEVEGMGRGYHGVGRE